MVVVAEHTKAIRLELVARVAVALAEQTQLERQEPLLPEVVEAVEEVLAAQQDMQAAQAAPV